MPKAPPNHKSIKNPNFIFYRVITREADLVTAHEFGHNWGSEHDPDVPECSPSARYVWFHIKCQ